MMRKLKRGFKRFKYDLMRSLSLTRRSHGEYFITIFVFVGIALFAVLHTLISMMVTNVEYKQTGYLDLYLEKTNICWRNESLSSASSFTNEWKTSLQPVNCQDPQHTLSTLLHSSHNNISSSLRRVDDDSVRQPLRRIFSGNCSSLVALHHSSVTHQQQQPKAVPLRSRQQPPLFDAGSCFEFHDSSSSSSLSSFFPLSLSTVSSSTTSSPFSNKLYRCLPSFLIIGAMKSGTGELMKWLNLHPFLRVGNGLQYEENLAASSHSKNSGVEDINAELDKLSSLSSSSQGNPTKEEKKKIKQKEEMRKEVLATNQKEVHFFSKYLYHLHQKHLHSSSSSSSFSLSSFIASLSPSQKYHILQQYLPYFPSFSGNNDDLATLYTFEKSPDYIRNKLIIELIHSLFPSMKLIIQLRNPSTRAVSEFHHNCRKNRYIKLISNLNLSNNRTYMKGNVLKNNDKLKDYHHHLPGEEGTIERESSSPSSSSSFHHNNHQFLDLFTVNAKELPINSYITLPYPCSVNDMMTFFTQFDSSYSSSSSSTSASTSSSASSKKPSRLRRKLLEAKNISISVGTKEDSKNKKASSTSSNAALSPHPLQKIKDSVSSQNQTIFQKLEDSRKSFKPSDSTVQKTTLRTPQSVSSPLPPLASQSTPAFSMKNHSRLHHQHSHQSTSNNNSSDSGRSGKNNNSGSKEHKPYEREAPVKTPIETVLQPQKHRFNNLPVSLSMLTTYPKEIMNGFYFNQINNILKM
jgi:hypothetical protein